MTGQEPARQWETVEEFHALADAEFLNWREAHERLAACDFASLTEFEALLERAAGEPFGAWHAEQVEREE